MRRPLLALLLLALALPAAAVAAPVDGSISVLDGVGTVTLTLRGVVVGRFDGGTLLVQADDVVCEELNVWGAEKLVVRVRAGDRGALGTTCVFSGKDIRFRLARVPATIKIVNSTNLDLSAVGRGSALLRGAGGPTDGTYSLNGDVYVSLPDEAQKVTLGSE